jgi:hypothetical protein
LGKIVTAPRTSALLVATIVACAMLQPSHAHAQWWSRAPADFEACADKAEKATTREARTTALGECNAKFAGRRKPGGGYTYFDFMQNRSFDIAGPNPTPQEQKHIDEQYTAYLARQRPSTVATALPTKELPLQPQQVSLREEKIPLPVEAPNKRRAARAKAANCAQSSLACDWPWLPEGLNELKRALFGSPSANTQTNPQTASKKRS